MQALVFDRHPKQKALLCRQHWFCGKHDSGSQLLIYHRGEDDLLQPCLLKITWKCSFPLSTSLGPAAIYPYLSAAMTSSLKHLKRTPDKPPLQPCSNLHFCFTGSRLKHLHTQHFYKVHVSLQYFLKCMFNSLRIKLEPSLNKCRCRQRHFIITGIF